MEFLDILTAMARAATILGPPSPSIHTGSMAADEPSKDQKPPSRTEFGRRLMDARKRLPDRPSRKAFAETTGITPSSIENWETGVSVPPADRLATLARHLGVSADYLLGLSDSPARVRVGDWLVDQGAVDRILSARSPQEVQDLFTMFSFVFALEVDASALTVDPVRFEELRRAVRDKVKEFGPLPDEWLDAKGKDDGP